MAKRGAAAVKSGGADAEDLAIRFDEETGDEEEVLLDPTETAVAVRTELDDAIEFLVREVDKMGARLIASIHPNRRPAFAEAFRSRLTSGSVVGQAARVADVGARLERLRERWEKEA